MLLSISDANWCLGYLPKCKDQLTAFNRDKTALIKCIGLTKDFYLNLVFVQPLEATSHQIGKAQSCMQRKG